MIHLSYPKQNHTTYESSTFLIGSLHPAIGTLLVNETPIELSPQGFFAHQIPLKPGENAFQLQALNDSGERTDEYQLTVIQHPPKATPPISPLAINTETETLLPNQSLTLTPGRWFHVACLASPNVEVSVTIPGVLKGPVSLSPYDKSQHDPSQETPYIDNRHGVFGELYQGQPRIPADGYYEGLVMIPHDALPVENVPIHLHLSRPKNQSSKPPHSLIQTLPATLSIWSAPKGARIQPAEANKNKTALVRTGPSSHAARLTPQLAGTSLMIDSCMGQWCRARLSPNKSFWISKQDIKQNLEVCPTSLALTSLRQITTHSQSPHQVDIVIPLARKIPLQIQYSDSDFVLSLYGVESHCDVIRLDTEQTVFSHIQWEQVTESQVDIRIKCPELSGYDYEYTPNGLTLRLKTWPQAPSDCVILIDPGHGGEETGTIGPNGLMEKTLNLRVAEQLIQALNAQGFTHVFSTRTEDTFVSLDTRSNEARNRQADLVISLHHNALPDGRDPLEHQGVSCFYYHPFSRKLAHTLQNGLAQTLSVNNYGLFYDSLAMTRIHECTSLLIEFGFFTHPQEFERLIDPKFQQRATATVASLIRAYLEKPLN